MMNDAVRRVKKFLFDNTPLGRSRCHDEAVRLVGPDVVPTGPTAGEIAAEVIAAVKADAKPWPELVREIAEAVNAYVPTKEQMRMTIEPNREVRAALAGQQPTPTGGSFVLSTWANRRIAGLEERVQHQVEVVKGQRDKINSLRSTIAAQGETIANLEENVHRRFAQLRAALDEAAGTKGFHGLGEGPLED